MPILLMIFGGLVALVALGTALASLSSYRRARKVARAPITPADRAVAKSSLVLRGRIGLGEGERLRSILTGEPVVWRKLEVREQVGEDFRVALREQAVSPFVLDDGSGTLAHVSPGGARIVPARVAGARSPLSARVAEHVESVGFFEWERTPRLCFEEMLVPGETVTVLAWAVHDGEGGSLHLVHPPGEAMTILAAGSETSRTLYYALAAVAVGMSLVLGGAYWGDLI
jgi:hypothetical protein